jgi:hypothetical protein
VKGVDPKPGHSRNLETKVSLQELFQVLSLPVIHDVVDQRLHLGMSLSGHIDPPDIPIDPYHWGQAC